MRNVSDIRLLRKLVADCITYGLSNQEGLKYIELEFKTISESSYKRYKTLLQSDKSAQTWMNYFTRIGFVQLHKKQIENIERIQEESLNTYFFELAKAREERDQSLLLRLKEDIRQNTRLLSELGLGTPVISGIKQRLQNKEKNEPLPESST